MAVESRLLKNKNAQTHKMREEKAGGEGEPTRGPDSDTSEAEGAGCREQLTEQVKKKKSLLYFQSQWVTQLCRMKGRI